MRNVKRIPIVLDLINWSHFITDNTEIKETDDVLPKLIKQIVENINNIKKIWIKYPDSRLGQLLINENYLPDYQKLWFVEEIDWLIDNNYCKYEDIHFWGKTRDSKGKLLDETQYILLKDLTDSHISAIIDWFDESLTSKLNSEYKKYFENRINKLKK